MRAQRDRKHSWAVVFLVVAVISLRAQTFKTLANFDNANGALPYGLLAQGTNGDFYGTTTDGGANGQGTVFEVTSAGILTILYSFCTQNSCADGSNPYSGLIYDADGNFYGTTEARGSGGFGTIFKITPRGTLATLHAFSGIDGANPFADLISDGHGKFYGTTPFGGIAGCSIGTLTGCGTLFKITSTGTLTTLHSFCSQTGCPDGALPFASLVRAIDGDFYGTSYEGGAYNMGTFFKISSRGTFTTLHSFDGADGINPQSQLLQAEDGNMYGTTPSGGTSNGGTIFKVTRKGTLTVLHNFAGADGFQPTTGLVQGTDGNLYGTTGQGGDLTCSPPYGCGTIFEIAPDGMFTTLHKFEFVDGYVPDGKPLQATDGNFYGTTYVGGSSDNCDGGCGTAYQLNVGLGPFVTLVRDSGKVSGTGGILGQGFTGTTNVSLNGTAVNFTVVADTFIRATVPSGATTGFVTVNTPSGTLTSNVPFRVLPQLLSFDPPSGPPGTQVTITGVSLTQTLGVGFGDRVQSQFTVNSDTSVTATVPQGAKTGKIGIETKGGMAISQGTFEVTE